MLCIFAMISRVVHRVVSFNDLLFQHFAGRMQAKKIDSLELEKEELKQLLLR